MTLLRAKPELSRVSVVVPCYNRARYLDVLLRSVSWSSVAPADFEVIVVDDGSHDRPQQVVDRWRARGLDVRMIVLRRDGGPRNNAPARNAGLRAARYPVILQTDPDIVFVSDVVRTARETLRPGLFLSCSAYYPLTEDATRVVAFGPEGPADVPDAFLSCASGRPNQVYSPDGVGGLHGAFACWRDDLRRVGGYDETFRYWGWEDRELIVTLEASGLRRQAMADTPVVHLWHPPSRGEVRRDELAPLGLMSRAAWDIQMQRASAEHPRPGRPRPSVSPSASDRPLEFGADAYDDWANDDVRRQYHAALTLVSAGELAAARRLLPLVYQLFFDAHRLEAQQLRTSGHVALARAVLRYALQRPWETERSVGCDPTFCDLPPAREGSWSDPALSLYKNVDVTLVALASCEELLGRHVERAAVLGALQALPGGVAAVSEVRARSALSLGDLAAAERDIALVPPGELTPGRATVAIEVAILSRRPVAAMEYADALLTGDPAGGDYFEQLRLIEYLRLLDRLDPAIRTDLRWPGVLIAPAATDESEFLFSAAMRSLRDGFNLGAYLLFARFAASAHRSDERLTRDGSAHQQSALARLSRVADAGVLVALGYSPPFQYSESKAAVVPSHA